MKKIKILMPLLAVICYFNMLFNVANAQSLNNESGSDNLEALPITERTLIYEVNGQGESIPVLWGLDTAWAWDVNFIRGSRFMGVENVDIARVSFTPSEELTNGTDLTEQQMSDLDWRLSIVDNYANANTQVILNDDHATVDSWYVGYPARWALLMDVTTRYVQQAGKTVVSISPFNEPDYGWGQGTAQDFYDIILLLKQNSLFDDIRISGGNTLNCDEALIWYNNLDPAGLDEGNTHQLAGSFDGFASFYQAVRSNGDFATGDEMHNVMEAMVGAEYGMQVGIWWGAAEYARGEFVKASNGVRLGYTEDRDNWTAASVYKGPDGKIEAFTGGSERQAVETSFRFVCKDKAVFYEGHGPQHEFIIKHPGGDGYMSNQPNAERVMNITWGDDIQPVIDGTYVLVNRNSGKVIEVENGGTLDGARFQQNSYVGETYQQLEVTPVDPSNGGDFSYFDIKTVHSGKGMDVYGWSLSNGGWIDAWEATEGSNQQWYLEYAEDGWFYIRSRYSALCLDVVDASTDDAAKIEQNELEGSLNQQWRLIPVENLEVHEIEFNEPAAPSGLRATARAESVLLQWTANSESDLSGYSIFRAESKGGAYNTIARNIEGTYFVDNSATKDQTYYYKIKAVDKILNRSAYSEEVSATTTGANSLVAQYKFEGDTQDQSINLNHGVSSGEISYEEGVVESQSILLNGSDAFVQLPADIANQQNITITAWVKWNGGVMDQHIFDFGNSDEECMYLTPESGSGQMEFVIKNGDSEFLLETTALSSGVWVHLAVSLGELGAKLYVNGSLVAENNSFSISPLDFSPVLNYIGRSQSSDVLYNGDVDDFCVYNYELTLSNVLQLYNEYASGIEAEVENENSIIKVWPKPADNVLYVEITSPDKKGNSVLKLYNINGTMVKSKIINFENQIKMDVSDLPTGLYTIQYGNRNSLVVEKVLINHQ